MWGCGGAIKPQLKHEVFKNEGAAAVNYVLRHTEVEVIAIFFLLLIYCVTEKNVCLESAGFTFPPSLNIHLSSQLKCNRQVLLRNVLSGYIKPQVTENMY